MREGWTRVAFGDVVRLSRERSSDPLADGFDRYLGLEHLDPGDLKIRRWGTTAEGTTFTNVFQPGQVLFGKRRPYQRKVATASFAGVCSGDLYVLEATGSALHPGLLPFLCQSDEFAHHAVTTSAGSLSPRTNWSSLAEFEFDLPSLSTQAGLANLFVSLDRAAEEYRSLSSSARHAKVALEAELFDRHGKQGPTLGELMSRGGISFQTGPFGSVLPASAYQDQGHPVINPVDMENGAIRADGAVRVGEGDWLRLQRYWVEAGDLLLGRKRHMSKLVFALPEHGGFVVGSDSIRIRAHDRALDPRFLFHVLRAQRSQKWLQAQAEGNGSVMPGMNEGLLGGLRLPLPDLLHQLEFARLQDQIDSACSSADRRRAEVSELKQHCLAASFRAPIP
jgi:type I restriction enzyme S subunit